MIADLNVHISSNFFDPLEGRIFWKLSFVALSANFSSSSAVVQFIISSFTKIKTVTKCRGIGDTQIGDQLFSIEFMFIWSFPISSICILRVTRGATPTWPRIDSASSSRQPQVNEINNVQCTVHTPFDYSACNNLGPHKSNREQVQQPRSAVRPVRKNEEWPWTFLVLPLPALHQTRFFK